MAHTLITGASGGIGEMSAANPNGIHRPSGPIKIRIMHTGSVCVSPALPFGGEHCSPIKASGVLAPRSQRLWLPVSTYLIEHPRGLVLADTGWSRTMSPAGTFDRRAQIASLGSRALYLVNQGQLPCGEAVDEQLRALGIQPADLSCVLLTHLDCDHANGLHQVADAQRILVARDELVSVRKNLSARIRYHKRWWDGCTLEPFDWNGTLGPVQKSYDLFGDGSIVCIAIPGHADGLFAVKVTGPDGRFVLLCSDGGYATRSWETLTASGIANNRHDQLTSLAWIREQALDPCCIAAIANHDPAVQPHVIELA